MKHGFSRFLCVVLALVMVLSLCACGKDKGSDDPNHMDFDDYTLDYKGACIMYDEYGRDALVMTFDFTNNSKDDTSAGWAITTKCMQGGVQVETAYVLADAETYESITKEYWLDIAPGVTLEVRNAFQLGDMSEVSVEFSELWSGKSYTITVDPSSLERIENETSGNDEWGDLSWVYDEDEETSGEEAGVASFTDWWSGDWYGWWIIRTASGAYEEMKGYWWDACAVLEVGEPAEDSAYNATLTIWDEEGSRTDGLICDAEVTLSPYGVGEHGTMYSESGVFMDQVLEHADWIIDPALEDVEDMISLDGEYSGEEGSYSYVVFLRPWGTVWDDMDEDDLPYAYNTWYLPLINSGASMPDYIDQGAVGSDTPADAAASGEEASGGTQGFGDFVSVLVPEEFTFKRDSWNEDNPHYVSIEKSDWTYFTLHNYTVKDEMESDYNYVKKTYTNEQVDVSASYGGIDWTGFQYSDGFGGYGFEVYTVIGENYLRVSSAGLTFDNETSKAVLGSIVMAGGTDTADTVVEADGEGNPIPEWLTWWEGDWYGWWIMTDATGTYSELSDSWWDACAVIEAYEDLTGYIELWDVDGSRDELLIGAAVLEFTEEGAGEHGTMYSIAGQFMDDLPEEGEWVVDPGTLAVDNIITIQGQYDGDEGGYTYKVYLRPWGALWDDLDEGYYPAGYYDWYLPLLDAGTDMPDSFE